MNNEKPETRNKKQETSPGWLWRMAWRDSRRSRSRLGLLLAAIALGVAVLVGINGFGDNLARSINAQARELLGADLVLTASQPLDADSALRPALARLPGQRSQEAAFASLVQVGPSKGVRLAQVRALTGNFPYYGHWDVVPAGAVAAFRQAGAKVALVDDALLVQFGARVGDSVKVGQLTFRIAGRVLKTPGQSQLGAALAPAVFIPGALLGGTGLVQPGSRVQYRRYFLLPPGTAADALVKPLTLRLEAANINFDTVASRQQQTGRIFADLTRFLNLVAFVALLLGCVGVASAVGLYVREKRAAVAVLRCLGATGGQALGIFWLQTSLLGLLGAALGAGLGAAVQALMPRLFAGFFPVEVVVAVSWPAVGQGLLTGTAMAGLFALLPLLAVRRVSPLGVLRADVTEATPTRPDPLRALVAALIVVFITGFAYYQTRDWPLALGFVGGLGAAFGALAGLGAGLRALVRRYLPGGWGYAWRQGLANLYRPNNQTITLVVSIGLSVFLLSTLALLQGLLLGQVARSGGGRRPNLVLFDIQAGQRAGVVALVRGQGLPVLAEVPVVTMRLSAVNGRPAADYRRDSTLGIPKSAFAREYRVTYRDSLISSETQATGTRPHLGPDGLPRVSVDERFLQTLHLKLGDTLTFNVQGLPLTTIVGGTRLVDWARVQTNFVFVFPAGVLESAPQFYVLLTRVPDNAALGAVQRVLLRQFPNVSAIDLGLILKTLDEVFSQVASVIRFMAFFSITTGLLVLISAVVVSRYQRVRESVLLRTLGASRRQLLRITLVEYALLGLLAAGTGLVLALLAAWALAVWAFKLAFVPALGPVLALAAGTTLLTALIGLLNSRQVLTRPPLEVLRETAG